MLTMIGSQFQMILTVDAYVGNDFESKGHHDDYFLNLS